MSNWRATYARRFNERMGLDRPRPFDIKAYAEWSDEEINAVASAGERDFLRRWRELVRGYQGWAP